MKITVVGAGMVGSTFAYRALASGMPTEIVLIDVNQEHALGEAEDLNDSCALEPSTLVRAGGYPDAADSDFVVITAGASSLEGGTRLDLCTKNAGIFKEILPQLAKVAPKAFYIIASNPVDVMAYAALKYSGLQPKQIIGSGTLLDSARLRYALSIKLGVAPNQIAAYILGEHGDSEVAIFSRVSVQGIPLENFLHQKKLTFPETEQAAMAEEVRTAAYRIVQRKKATYYGIASSLVRIIEAIWRDEKAILPVSTLAQGEYDVHDTYMSMPTVLGKHGVEEILDLSLTQTEFQALLKSAKVLQECTIQLPE